MFIAVIVWHIASTGNNREYNSQLADPWKLDIVEAMLEVSATTVRTKLRRESN